MTRKPKSPFILWLDTETTGSDDDTNIIEIGLILTDRELNEIAATEYLCQNGMSEIKLHQIDPTVVEMHAKNGLWRDLLDTFRPGRPPRLQNHDTLDRTVLAWLANMFEQHTPDLGATPRINLYGPTPYAGSGVGHFDSHLIRRNLPKFAAQLTYWPYDVGPLRRFIRLAGFENLIPKSAEPGDKPHRALADTRLHLAEAKHYMKLFRKYLPSTSLQEMERAMNRDPEPHIDTNEPWGGGFAPNH